MTRWSAPRSAIDVRLIRQLNMAPTRRASPFKPGERGFISRYPLDYVPTQMELFLQPQEYRRVTIKVAGVSLSVVSYDDDPDGPFATILNKGINRGEPPK